MKKKLTNFNIIKLKDEKLNTYALLPLLVCVIIFMNIIYSASFDFVFDEGAAITISFLIFIIGFTPIFLYNRPYNQDLKEGIKVIELSIVKDKYIETSYEAGSGSLYIPILADIFPKYYGRRMKANYFNCIKIDNYQYRIDANIYNQIKIDDEIEMHFAPNSRTLLEIIPAASR